MQSAEAAADRALLGIYFYLGALLLAWLMVKFIERP
jgi:hypothetical protein